MYISTNEKRRQLVLQSKGEVEIRGMNYHLVLFTINSANGGRGGDGGDGGCGGDGGNGGDGGSGGKGLRGEPPCDGGNGKCNFI